MQQYVQRRYIIKTSITGLLLLVTIFFSCSCGYVTYRRHGAKQQYLARPNVLFMDGIINYRSYFHDWPRSLEQFANSSVANRKLVEDFKYHDAYFKVIDSNRLKVSFFNYKKASYVVELKGTVDINGLGGTMRFVKTKEGYTWKLKMR